MDVRKAIDKDLFTVIGYEYDNIKTIHTNPKILEDILYQLMNYIGVNQMKIKAMEKEIEVLKSKTIKKLKRGNYYIKYVDGKYRLDSSIHEENK